MINGNEKCIIKKLRKLPELTEAFSGVPANIPAIPQGIQMYYRQKKTLDTPKKFLHHRYILILSVEGKGDVLIDDYAFKLDAGKGLLIFPGQIHNFANIAKDIKWSFSTFSVFTGASSLDSMKNRVFVMNSRTYELASLCLSHYHGAVEGKTSSAMEMAFSFGSLLNNVLEIVNDSAPSPIYKIDYDDSRRQLIKQVNDFIFAKISSSLTLKDVAKHVNVSESHLRSIFKETLKVSLGKFIRYKRMSVASSLLRSSDMNISAIAKHCGFSSVYTFSRAFKAEAGVPPLKFREKSRS